MFIQVGMRTDIPAFYSEWFVNRLQDGLVLVRNPYNSHIVTSYILSPDVVDLIAFCTKNPAPMLDKISYLENYRQYWSVTITPYNTDIEPRVPYYDDVILSFIKLSKLVGAKAMGWRYDPIIINHKYNIGYHIASFRKIAERLAGYTHSVVISFIQLYPKVRRNFFDTIELGKDSQLALANSLVKIAKEFDMVIRPCGTLRQLPIVGADLRGCATAEFYERVLDISLSIPSYVNRRVRSECSCLLSGDIGAYDSCPHLCRYCYANTNRDSVWRNYYQHDVNSPFLIGGRQVDDIIKFAKQESWIRRQVQMTLF